MTPTHDTKGQGSVDLRAAIGARCCQMRESCGNVQFGQGIGQTAQYIGAFQHVLTQLGKNAQLNFERRLVRARDPPFQFGQLGRCKTHGIGQRLAVDEYLPMRLFEQLGAMTGGHFDKITQHAIVADLQGSDIGLVNQARLQRRHHGARFAGQCALVIECRVIALAHKTTIAAEQRHVIIECRHQFSG